MDKEDVVHISNGTLLSHKKNKIMPFVATCIQLAAAAKSLQSCPTLCDPTDGSPPGLPVPEILQVRTLEWVAISFSNQNLIMRKQTSLYSFRNINVMKYQKQTPPKPKKLF